MKKSFLLIPLALLLLGAGCKKQGAGFYSPQAPVSNQFHGSITTIDATTSTLATFPIAPSSTVSVFAVLAANSINGVDGAGGVCIGTFKNTATGTVVIGQGSGSQSGIGLACPAGYQTNPAWGARFVVTTSTVSLNVTGAASTTVNWNSNAIIQVSQ